MPRAPRLLLAAGGTGGHLFPGVAVAEGAQRKAGAMVLFVGTTAGMEKDVIPQLGFSLRFIPAEQLRGRTWWGKIRAIGVAGCGVGSAWRLVREFAPDVILSIGGYASAPTVLAGWLQRIPCVLLEPNAIPGLANRFLSWFAARVCLGFETANRFFPSTQSCPYWQSGTPCLAADAPAGNPGPAFYHPRLWWQCRSTPAQPNRAPGVRALTQDAEWAKECRLRANNTDYPSDRPGRVRSRHSLLRGGGASGAGGPVY